MDKAGKQYWDRVWAEPCMLATIDPREPGMGNYVVRRFHDYFRQLFSGVETRQLKLLEIGCGNSAWLPYFAVEFGFAVSGIDYSEVGCAQAEKLLRKAGVEGEIFCSDFFTPPDRLIEAFDVAISFGVVEHFSDTPGCLRAFAKFLKPGGLLITNLPNLSGLNGMIQKIINRPIFDVHVPLDGNDLIRAHQAEQFQGFSCRYFLFFNLGVLNFENWRGTFLYSVASKVRTLINRIVWLSEKAIPLLGPNRWTSPYIHCLAVKAGMPHNKALFSGRW